MESIGDEPAGSVSEREAICDTASADRAASEQSLESCQVIPKVIGRKLHRISRPSLTLTAVIALQKSQEKRQLLPPKEKESDPSHACRCIGVATCAARP